MFTEINTLTDEQQMLTHGFVKCKYDTLVSSFGNPALASNSNAIWHITHNGRVMSIVGKTNSPDDYIYDNTDWAILGVGESNYALYSIKEMLDSKLGSLSKYLTRYDIVTFF